MSDRRLQKLEAIICALERKLDVRPDYYMAHVYFGDDGSEVIDVERFERDYGITPDAMPPMTTLFLRQHFEAPDPDLVELKASHLKIRQDMAEMIEAQRRLHEPNVGEYLKAKRDRASGGVSQTLQPGDVADNGI